MDQLRYTQLTGKVPTSSQASRFELVSEVTQKFLEGMLGWSLDPSALGNQYTEIGKTSTNDFSCLDVDTDNLEDPDEVVGSYRLYTWNGTDRNIHIDPAITIHKVKLVKNGVTYVTYDEDNYHALYVNNDPQYARYLQLCDDCLCSCIALRPGCRMVAVDADWAFADILDEDDALVDIGLPLELQKVWADLIAEEFDLKRDVKSESITSHSYTKYDRVSIPDQYKRVLQQYMGPRSNLKRPRIV